eukprot:5564385-Alexandrium_andersonii.AAC.1
MSASLVGSEMCIRDSHPSSGGRCPGAPAGGRSAVGLAASAGLDGHASVSYTHLTLPTICSV